MPYILTSYFLCVGQIWRWSQVFIFFPSLHFEDEKTLPVETPRLLCRIIIMACGIYMKGCYKLREI